MHFFVFRRNDKIIIFSDVVFALRNYAKALNRYIAAGVHLGKARRKTLGGGGGGWWGGGTYMIVCMSNIIPP